MAGTLVVVPAYRPDGRLVDLVVALGRHGLTDVLVVDDGSGPDHAATFEEVAGLGAQVLRHEVNRGKGAALRTALAHVVAHRPGADVVTADADGQHRAQDVARVAAALRDGEADLVLGVRDLSGRDVPLRSRAGNAVARWAFRLVAGRAVRDTQTGLRGLRHDTLRWVLEVGGDGFDHEYRVLLRAAARGASMEQVPVETVYLEHNASSHFRPLQDSAHVLGPVLAFAASGLLAFGVDAGLLLGVQALTGSLLVAVLAARAVSAGVNFAVNRALVFRRGGVTTAVRDSAWRYLALAGLLLAASYGMLDALHGTFGVPLLAAKVVTDATLFLASYTVQRNVVFATPAPAPQANPKTGGTTTTTPAAHTA